MSAMRRSRPQCARLAPTFVAVVALALSAAGCDNSPDRPLALVHASQGMDGARIDGRLTLVEGCLYITNETTGGRTLPILPHPGTDWDEQEQVLTVRGVPYRVGLPIGLGGSGGPAETGWRDRIEWVQPPPKSCDPDELWFSPAGGDYGPGITAAPAAWYLALSPPALDATVAGELLIEQGCIYLVREDGTKWQPVFPDGTFVDSSTYTVFGLPLDQRTELRGGPVEVANHGIVGLDAWVSPLNPSCDTSHLWLITGGRTLGRR